MRVVGVDVLRGLAVLGMFTAHLGEEAAWSDLADGRSAATFALLAGVSATLLGGGAADAGARARILTRAALLWPIGVVLVALGTPVAVILPSYALMFAVLAAVLHLRSRTLLVLAAAVLAVGGPLLVLVRAGGDPPGLLELVVGEHYPAATWLAYLLVGVTVGRLDLHAPSTAVRLLVGGPGLAALVYGVSAVALDALPERATVWRALLTTQAHADAPAEVVANTGVALGALGLCLLVARARWAVLPLAATGALALTAYTGHVIAIAVLGNEVVRDPDDAVLATFVLVTVASATAWRLTLGRGPLERLLHGASVWVAGAFVVPGPDRAVAGDRAP